MYTAGTAEDSTVLGISGVVPAQAASGNAASSAVSSRPIQGAGQPVTR